MFTPGSETTPKVTADGSYFIDACPRAFHFVLNWLRKRGEVDFLPVIPKDVFWRDVGHAAAMIGIDYDYDYDGSCCHDKDLSWFLIL